MTTREQLQSEIAELTRKLDLWVEKLRKDDPAISGMHTQVKNLMAKHRIDLAVAKDSLKLLNEEHADGAAVQPVAEGRS